MNTINHTLYIARTQARRCVRHCQCWHGRQTDTRTNFVLMTLMLCWDHHHHVTINHTSSDSANGPTSQGLLLNISEKLHVCPHIRHAHAIHSATVSTLGALTKAESDNCLLCSRQLLNISRKKPHTVPLYPTVTKTVYKNNQPLCRY